MDRWLYWIAAFLIVIAIMAVAAWVQEWWDGRRKL